MGFISPAVSCTQAAAYIRIMQACVTSILKACLVKEKSTSTQFCHAGFYLTVS